MHQDARFISYDTEFNTHAWDPGHVVYRSLVAPLAVPEPGAWALLLARLGLVGWSTRKGIRN
ncbi:MAG: PEP-CTERM sorting domain-containing protein [Pseudomonadota bacterium]